MEEKLTVAELLMFVEEGQLNKLELYDQVEQLTRGFQLERLKILAKDVEYHIYNRTDELEWQYREEIEEKINEHKRDNKPLPIVQFTKPGPDATKGAHRFYEEASKAEVINRSALLPMEAQMRIFALRMLKALIISKIQQQAPGAGKAIKANGQDRKYTIRQVALFYYYAQQTKELPHFRDMAPTLEAAYKMEAPKFDFSHNTLEQNTNKVYITTNRINKNQVKNIQQAIKLLGSKGYHKAVELAEKELRQAEKS